MRICFVSHGFPPVERTGVENYTEALARALSRTGHGVEVFAPKSDPVQPDYALRREERGGYAVNWIIVNRHPSGPREMLDRPPIADEFGRLLDREQPEVVHFQHVVKLGVGLIHEAARRGIPTVYTAHDYYAICHRYTLLRPDLSHCDVRNDPSACARCDLALGYLNGIPELGDYQMGVLPDQLDEERLSGLEEILASGKSFAETSTEEYRTAVDRRRLLDGLRAQAFGAVDRILAPTKFLAGELVRGGLEREKIEVLPYGIENADLQKLPPVGGREEGRRLRFGFFGGISKHKGLHVLIEGFRQADLDADLCIWGYSSDAPYVEEMRARALAAGALWRGAYAREELPELLAEVDVVVVPSLWVENLPLVILEAFSAGRPVVASRFGAIPETVHEGVNGLLFGVGDAIDLARTLRRFVDEPGLEKGLAARIGEVKDVDRQAAELVERYTALADERARRRSRTRLPPSLSPFVMRHAELAALPTRDLFRRALTGLHRLRRSWGEGIEGQAFEEVMVEALAGETRAQVFLRDARREIEWLRGVAGDLGAGRAELERAYAEIQRAFDEAHLRASTAEQEVAQRESALAELEEQFQKTAELGLLTLRTQDRLLCAELWLVLNRLGELVPDAEIDHLPPASEASSPELLSALKKRVEALEDMNQEVKERRRRLRDLEHEAAWLRDSASAFEEEARWRREKMRSLEGEVGWRRDEMRRAFHAIRGDGVKRLVRKSAIGKVVTSWVDAGVSSDDEPEDAR